MFKLGFPIAAMIFASTCFAQMGPSQVAVEPVELRSVELTEPLVATVSPVTQSTIAAEQEGIIEQRDFDEGQRVKKGDVLARVNTDLLKAQRDAAAAAVKAAVGELQQSQSELDNAKREVDRLTDLFEQRVAPEKEYRDSLTARDMISASAAAREARLAQRNAELQHLEAMLRKATTHSPLDGVVAKRYVEVGQWIEQGAAIADLVQLDPLFVEVNVPEGVITSVKHGDPARVEIDALAGKLFTGKVDQILPQADAASRTFRVKIILPNPDLAIWPGFFARAALSSTSADKQFVVPKDAVVTRGPISHVVAARQPMQSEQGWTGSAVVVPVTMGRADGTRVCVVGDLQEGDWVVVRGNESLRGGESLMIQGPPTTLPAATQPAGASAASSAAPQSAGN